MREFYSPINLSHHATVSATLSGLKSFMLGTPRAVHFVSSYKSHFTLKLVINTKKTNRKTQLNITTSEPIKVRFY